MTAIVIIGILAVLLIGATDSWRARAEKAKCLTNLSGLYVGASSYIQEQGSWPQVDPHLVVGQGNVYAMQWFKALQPYGISRAVWVCPTIQRGLNYPDLTDSNLARADYLATPFDTGARTPYKWSTQPWFIEKTSSHPGGNLMIFADGLTLTLIDAARRMPPPGE